MTTDPHTDWDDIDLAAYFRGRRDQELLDETLTEEQEAARAKRRAILGSSEDTHALNASERERGCTILLPVIGLAFVVLGGWLYLADRFEPWQAVGFWVLGSFALAAVACCANDGTRERLDAEAPKGGAR